MIETRHKHDLKHHVTKKHVSLWKCAGCQRVFTYDKFALRLMLMGAVKWQDSYRR